MGLVRACTYLRRSTGLQAYSIEHQEQALAEYADQHGYQIVETFSDDASGLTLKKRPGLKQLLQRALGPEPGFSTILVYDVSRWGRFQDLDQGAHYEFLVRKAGIAVEYCHEPFENDGSPEANLIKQIKRSMAAEYSRALSKRIADAKLSLAARGFIQTSTPPYGLRRALVDPAGNVIMVMELGEQKLSSRHRSAIVPGPAHEVALIERIFGHYVHDRLGILDIARRLNAEGLPSPRGRAWSDSTVRKILLHEAYVGTFVFGRTSIRLGGKSAPEPEGSWTRIENAFPAILERSLFEAAQTRLKAKSHRHDTEMLNDLRKLLRSKKRLDTGLIDAAPGMNGAANYIKRFGGLRRAYALIGYDPVKTSQRERQARIAASRRACTLQPR